MKKIKLTQNQFALVDDSDFENLSKFKWHFNTGYAERKENGNHIRMHRVILKAKDGVFVDHINGDKLDNRKCNLRLATRSQNAMNMKVKGYKGITKVGNNWRVQIWKDNKRVFSATAPNERWAAMIYDLNAPIYFGEFVRPNFPQALTGIYDLP